MEDPFQVSRQWGGILRSIEFAIPKPLLPASTIMFLHYAGVPSLFEVTSYQHLRFDFSAAAQNLSDVWAAQMPEFSLPVGWGGLWRIGEISATQADVCLCVEEVTGRVFGLDVGIDDPLYLVNGSIERLVRCMWILYDWSRSGDVTLARVSELITALSHDAALPKGESEAFWLPLVAQAVESGCDRLEVRCD